MVLLRKMLFLTVLGAILAGCGGSLQTENAETVSNIPSSDSVAVARYADTTLTLAAFESAYAESNGGREEAAKDSLGAYENFLEQYVNYRLKVQAARDAGLDTASGVQQEIRSYRRKLARPRLMRTHIYEPLLRELHTRRQEEVDVSHILIQVPSNASPEDTLSAYRTLQTLADSLDQGVPFADLAYRHSDDPSAQKEGQRGYEGRIGYLRAGQIVEPFEDRMYALDPGEVSEIFRTQFGYHLIKVHDRRPTQQPIRLSHIMLRPGDDPGATRRRLDSLRAEIVENDADFSEMARQHSEDQRSASQGGDLGEVSTFQSLPDGFRQAATALDTVGAVSEVVQSPYGFHLLKLTDRQERRSFEAAYDDLKEQISDQPRVERQKTAFAQTVRTEEGVTVDTARILDAADAPSVDTLARPLLSLTDASSSSPVVATLGDSSYTVRQMAQHLMQADGGAQLSIENLIEEFLNAKAFDYALARLERQDPSFAATMKEYREGVLLFRYMQDSVWTAAAQDTSGLRAAYEQNKDEYRFPERIRTIVLRAPADSLLQPYQSTAETASVAETVQHAAQDSLVALDTTFVTDQSPEVYQPVQSLQDGSTAGPLEHENEVLLLLRDGRLAARQKSFDEARSDVLQDYQNTYEEKVLRRLRERYEAETYPERLRHAFDESASSTPTP